MTTVFMKRSPFPDGETEPHGGAHAQGLERLLYSRLKPVLAPHPSCRKGPEGTLPMQTLGSCGPGDKRVGQRGAWDLRFGEGASEPPQSRGECLRKEREVAQRLPGAVGIGRGVV